MSKKEQALSRIRIMADLMDSRFRIPGTHIRFGLDPILSLLPVAGSTISYIIGAYLVIEMVLAGASGKVAVKMILNILVDAIFGAIPIIGVIPDIFYRANNRNFRLLQEHYAEGRHQGSGIGIIISILVIVLVIVGMIAYGIARLFQAIF